jgi:hypothetical protein
MTVSFLIGYHYRASSEDEPDAGARYSLERFVEINKKDFYALLEHRIAGNDTSDTASDSQQAFATHKQVRPEELDALREDIGKSFASVWAKYPITVQADAEGFQGMSTKEIMKQLLSPSWQQEFSGRATLTDTEGNAYTLIFEDGILRDIVAKDEDGFRSSGPRSRFAGAVCSAC